jgi:hypothetical protein
MRKYKIFYWVETGDDCDWFEKIIEAHTIDDALAKFRDKNRLQRVDSIALIPN